MAVPIRVMTALAKQQADMGKNPPDGITLIKGAGSEITDIQADILGPSKTPYEGGVFRCQLRITSQFPMKPPKGYFLTKIFHPNVSSSGEICVNTLKKDWNPAKWSLRHIFEVIKCLLIVPFPESSLNEEAGKLFMEDFQEFSSQAQMYTKIYAQKKSAEPSVAPHQALRLSEPLAQKEEHEKHLYKKSVTLGGFQHDFSASPVMSKSKLFSNQNEDQLPKPKSISPKRKIGSFYQKSPENSIFLKSCDDDQDSTPLSGFSKEIKGGFIAGALRSGSSLFQSNFQKPVLNPMTMNVGEQSGPGFTPKSVAEQGASTSSFSLGFGKKQENSSGVQQRSFFTSALENGSSLFATATKTSSSLFGAVESEPRYLRPEGTIPGPGFLEKKESESAGPLKKDKWMMRRI